MKFNPSNDNWNRFCAEALSFRETNVIGNFKQLSRKYGDAYLAYLESAWIARGDLTEAEFISLNGGVPKSFIDKHLRKTDY